MPSMRLFSSCLAAGAIACKATNWPQKNETLFMFPDVTESHVEAGRLQDAFDAIYRHFNRSFDFDAFENAMKQFQLGLQSYEGTDAYRAYEKYPDRPHCDAGSAVAPAFVSGVAAFPGGVTQTSLGSDLAKTVHDLGLRANGPASAGLIPVTALGSENLRAGMGIVQSVIAAMVHTIPPLVPPPTWNNQPLPCVPMSTGHNCFGAVLYPITMADFVLADVTDSMLDGVIAGFPETYASKVGKTNDAMYTACFASYMSMHCSSIFPRCTAPQSRDEPIPVGGRVPMCLHLCIMPLVMCPGFWVDDIIGTCSIVSVPPLCTQAFFSNLWRLPPQYANYDEANPFPKECPRGIGTEGQNPMKDASLYDVPNVMESPILKEAAVVQGEPLSAM